MPFRLRSSSTRVPPSWRQMSAWRRETVGSSRRMSAARLRPILRPLAREGTTETRRVLVGQVLARLRGSSRTGSASPGPARRGGRRRPACPAMSNMDARDELGVAAVRALRNLVERVQGDVEGARLAAKRAGSREGPCLDVFTTDYSSRLPARSSLGASLQASVPPPGGGKTSQLVRFCTTTNPKITPSGRKYRIYRGFSAHMVALSRHFSRAFRPAVTLDVTAYVCQRSAPTCPTLGPALNYRAGLRA